MLLLPRKVLERVLGLRPRMRLPLCCAIPDVFFCQKPQLPCLGPGKVGHYILRVYLQALLYPLLALFHVTNPTNTRATLVPQYKFTYHLVMHNTAHGILVAFLSPARCIELWPIDLYDGVSNASVTWKS